MSTERYYEHQSLALLAGVAVDKGPEDTLTESHTLQLFDPSGSYTLSSSSISEPGSFSIVEERTNVIQTSNRNISSEPVRLPLKLQMTHTSGIDEALSDNVVEVQYIIDPGGQFQVTTDDESETNNSSSTNKIILSSVTTNHVQRNVLHFRQPQSPDLQAFSADNTGQIQTKGDFNIGDGNIVIVQEQSESNDNLVHQHIMQIKDSDGVSSRNIVYSHSSNSTSLLKPCFLCQESGTSGKNIFDASSREKMIPKLLITYMNISIPTSNSNCSKNCIICDKCEQMLLRWHEVISRYRNVNPSVSATLALETSEDDNSVGEQFINSKIDKPNECELSDLNESKASNTVKSNSQKKSGVRKYRYSSLQNQIKTQIFASAYHYLIKRDLGDEDWEYIAERLHTTKSNSSMKMKEIETLTFQPDNLVSIFCDECKKSIPGGKEGYYNHRKAVHENTPVDHTLPCDMCGKHFPEQDSTGLSRNYFRHWIKHFYFEECQDCKEKFPNPSLLKKHMVAHQQRPAFPCPKCNKVLSKKTTLEQHIKTHLPEEEKKKNALTCQLCGKMITAPTLKAHMFSVHSDLRPWRCEVCGAKFKHKSDLSGHRNAVHLKIKKFNCNVCGKSFGHHCGLRVHMMKHENRREHECSVCGKKFITQWHLKKHTVTHKEERDIICETCGKGFKKMESLQEHMTLHTGEFPYECHICGRKVRVLSNLYKHFMVHKKNKTYYSKKDGLPDPLDAYIMEQRKRKQVNSIVEEMDNSPGQPVLMCVTSAGPSLSPSTAPDSTEHDLERLHVNRSSTRVTYPASAPSLIVDPHKKNVFLSASTTELSSSPMSNDVGVIIPTVGQTVYRVPIVEGNAETNTNAQVTTGVIHHPSTTSITSTLSPFLTYRIIDENGVEMDTIRIPS